MLASDGAHAVPGGSGKIGPLAVSLQLPATSSTTSERKEVSVLLLLFEKRTCLPLVPVEVVVVVVVFSGVKSNIYIARSPFSAPDSASV